MSTRIPRMDAHQHFWKLERGDYGWLTPEMGDLYRDYTPDDLLPLLKTTAIEGTILVQAAPTEAETDFMLQLARSNDFILGVVGWVDFEDEDASGKIKALATEKKLVGLRPMIQDIPDDLWMLQGKLTPAFRAMTETGLTFDALTLPRHLPHLHNLLERHPDLTCVIDHGSKPNIREGQFRRWSLNMKALAEGTSAYCKLSGLVTEASDNWTASDLKPYVDHLLDCFGPQRLIWGSDWPVCTLAASYETWMATTEELLSGLPEEERALIHGGNALKAYGLPVDAYSA